jgi:pantoate--beta-alanine ligase
MSRLMSGATMQVLATRAELCRALSGQPAGDRVLVMTMGALHDGHLQLVHRARALAGDAGQVVATIFVNPLQFGAGEDLDRYPRSLDADLAALRDAGADLVFTPDQAQMYPQPPQVRVDPGPLGQELEGAVRPGHFAGVLTVVAKMFNLVRPAAAVFGEKDYQQLVLIERMVADLDLPVRIVGVQTVREPDGLARSSRNRYLNESARARATTLARALTAAATAAADGADADAVLAAAAGICAAAGVVPDYLQLRDPALGPPPADGPARLLVAARFDDTRLIDNAAIELAVSSGHHSPSQRQSEQHSREIAR